jgi:hypothetical protein
VRVDRHAAAAAHENHAELREHRRRQRESQPGPALRRRMVLGLPLEIHQHHDEQVEHDDAAGVDEYLNGREELRRQQDIQRRDAQEVQDEKEHRVDGVLRGHHEHREAEDECRDDVERDGVAHQNNTFTMPVTMTFAIATGISTFHPSRMSWSYR